MLHTALAWSILPLCGKAGLSGLAELDSVCYHLQNMALVRKVEALAAQKDCKPGQLALAWVLARGNDAIPIPSTKRANCYDENLAALQFPLTPEECEELEDAVPHHKVRL